VGTGVCIEGWLGGLAGGASLRAVDLALRLLRGGVFIYAGAVKAWSPTDFVRDIEGYRLLPAGAAFLVALYLPWLEIICGGCLISNWLRRGSFLALTLLLLIFIAALASAWLRGLDISCGCFGADSEPGRYSWLLLRDIVILMALLWTWAAVERPTPRTRTHDRKR